MKNTSKKLVIHQPTNKKYLLEKTVLEMKDQNDNQTNDEIKEEPFLIENCERLDTERPVSAGQRRILHCSDGAIELDENGNIIEEVKKRNKRDVNSVIKHRIWNPIDSVDSPILNSATNLSSTVGRKTLSAIDYVGNMVASVFGSKFN